MDDENVLSKLVDLLLGCSKHGMETKPETLRRGLYVDKVNKLRKNQK